MGLTNHPLKVEKDYAEGKDSHVENKGIFFLPFYAVPFKKGS